MYFQQKLNIFNLNLWQSCSMETSCTSVPNKVATESIEISNSRRRDLYT